MKRFTNGPLDPIRFMGCDKIVMSDTLMYPFKKMGGVTFAVCLVLLSGCSSLPKPVFSDVVYDYKVKPPYALTPAYKTINVSLDARNTKLPEKTFSDESIKFKWTPSSKTANFSVYIHLSNSFLIERENTVKQDVVYDENGRGGFVRIGIQRAFIRTHYTVEVVDNIKDVLINQVNAAGNVPIEAKLSNDLKENKKILKKAFYQELTQAREKLMLDIWQGLKTHHLAPIQTTFGKLQNKVVSELSVEPKFKQAYNLLKSNRKRNAVKALKIYNDGMAFYKGKDDKLSNMIRQHLDHGITVSSAIANHEYPDRYK